MAYNCKIFDKNGNLKKIIRNSENFSGITKNFLNQKSTKRALSYIKTMKDPKIATGSKVTFHTKECIVCKMVFHPRHKHTKYCSHECQHKLYKEQKEIRKKIRSVNTGKKI
jgi:hypothetical protein